MFLLHNDLFQCHQYTQPVSFRLNDLDTLVVDFKYSIISVILFTKLFANEVMICSTSGVNPSALIATLNRSFFRSFVSCLVC